MSDITKKYNGLESALISYYDDRKDELFDSCHPAVAKLRKEAFEAFMQTGLPNNKVEQWRTSLLTKNYESGYVIDGEDTPFEKTVNEIFHCEIHGYNAHVVSMLNGWFYSANADKLQILDNGVVLGSMLVAQKEYPELFDKHYGKIALNNNNGFTSINSALFRDGLFVYVPDGVEVENAIQLIKMVNREDNLLMNSRNLMILGKNSKLSFMHCDDSVNHSPSFINTVTEIYLDQNASIDLYKMQNINDETSLLNNTFIHQERDSRSQVTMITLNGGKIRNDLHIDLQGQNAEADLNGVYLMDKKQHVDNQIYVKHSAPNCNSSELFKGVLDESATGVFNGYVYVARDAQKTNAFQRNNNILMTAEANIDTMPFLEIYADDVKCSHGATVGQLDDNALFYLMQRGINKSDARLLLMYAFISEVTSKINIEPLRNSIDDMVKKRLRGELSICEKCVLHCSVPDRPIEFEIDMSKV